MTNRITLIAVAIALSSSGVALAAPVELPLDAQATSLIVRTYKGGAAAALAHDHAVKATRLSGSITIDGDDPSTADVVVKVDARSLVVDDASARKAIGLTGEVDADTRATVTKTMMSAEQLDVAKFPEMVFTSRGVEATADGYVLVGALQLHGVTKKVRVPFTARVNNGHVVADGKLRFKGSDYGIEPYSAMLGAVKNRDELELHLHVVAHATGGLARSP